MKAINIIFLIFLIINIISGEDIYYIKINNIDYLIEFKETETANQIKAKIPFTVKMINLNGNEVYHKFDESFTTNKKSVGTINMGDIYLYQSDYLVLFYKTFTTSYQYTEIGKLKNTTGLDTNISGDVMVQWLKKSDSSNEEGEKEKEPEPVHDPTSSVNDKEATDEIKDSSKPTEKPQDSSKSNETPEDSTKPTEDTDNIIDRYSGLDFISSKYMILMCFICLILLIIK